MTQSNNHIKIIALAWLILIIIFLLSTGCRKEVIPNSVNDEISSSTNLGITAPALQLCSPKTVPLCAGKTINIGTVTVSTGSDNKVYITYSVTGDWRLVELHLYAGPDAGIPVNGPGNPIPGQFPYTQSFIIPYIVQEYTFVISNLPSTFTVAAHAAVVRVLGNQVVQGETAWGDGCDGDKISPKGNWGTKFTYTQQACPPPQQIQEAELCSYSLPWFYGPSQPAWPDVNSSNAGNITIAGFDYTEAEARAIFNSTGMPDSKNGFINVSALRLSNTNVALQADLLLATTTIESWLYSYCGKLSPSNLPTGNPAVENAANFLNSWIQTHICWHEE